jgi:hypothetical protein
MVLAIVGVVLLYLYIKNKNNPAVAQAQNSVLSSGGTASNTQSGNLPVEQVLANLNSGPTLGTGVTPGSKAVAGTGTVVVHTNSNKDANGVYQANPALNNPTIPFSNAGAAVPPVTPAAAALPSMRISLLSNNTSANPAAVNALKPASGIVFQGTAIPVETSAPLHIGDIAAPVLSSKSTFGASTGIALGKGL